MMIDTLEKTLIEALKTVDAHGDVAPAHVHDPMTMLLRENVVRDKLVRWDGLRGCYVLTGIGRWRNQPGQPHSRDGPWSSTVTADPSRALGLCPAAQTACLQAGLAPGRTLRPATA